MNKNPFEWLKKLKGVVIAMKTPIKNINTIYMEGHAKLTCFYIDNCVKNLIAAGTSGYCYSLTTEKYENVVEMISVVNLFKTI